MVVSVGLCTYSMNLLTDSMVCNTKRVSVCTTVSVGCEFVTVIVFNRTVFGFKSVNNTCPLITVVTEYHITYCLNPCVTEFTVNSKLFNQ